MDFKSQTSSRPDFTFCHILSMKLNRFGFPLLFELKGHFITPFVKKKKKGQNRKTSTSFSQGGGSAEDPLKPNSPFGESSDEVFIKKGPTLQTASKGSSKRIFTSVKVSSLHKARAWIAD